MIIEVFERLRSEIASLKYKFLQFDKIDIDEIKAFVTALPYTYKNIIIIGFGASSLNIKALHSLSKTNQKVIFLDNLDQSEVEKKLAEIPNDFSTIVLSISRIGNTRETYFLTNYLLEVKKFNAENMIIICPNNNNKLFNLSKKYSTKFYEHTNFESGRFGIISTPSLLVLYLIGINIDNIIHYSQRALDEFLTLESDIIVEETLWYYKNFDNNNNIYVLWNFSYQLKGLCLWQRQLYAESLGKNNYGATPIISTGSMDEHSQFQLYIEGPQDKFYKILFTRTPNQFINLELHILKLYEYLKHLGKPVKLELLEEFNEQNLTKLIIKSLLVTLLLSEFLQINPLNQDSVDFIKTKL